MRTVCVKDNWVGRAGSQSRSLARDDFELRVRTRFGREPPAGRPRRWNHVVVVVGSRDPWMRFETLSLWTMPIGPGPDSHLSSFFPWPLTEIFDVWASSPPFPFLRVRAVPTLLRVWVAFRTLGTGSPTDGNLNRRTRDVWNR